MDDSPAPALEETPAKEEEEAAPDAAAMEATPEAEAPAPAVAETDDQAPLIVRLRGLPYATTPQDVQDFFGDLKIAPEGIWLLGNGAGEAFVSFDESTLEEAALAFHKKYIGERYIEVMKTDTAELEARRRMSKADAHGNGEGDSDDLPNYAGVIRMRGLPWTSTEDDIREFFSDCAGLRAGDLGVFLCRHPDGRSRGMAYAVFDAEDLAQAALQAKDRQQMGGRYIELFQATKGELNSQRNDASRSSGRPQVPAELPNEGILKIKGLPWTATVDQIRAFFRTHEKPELAGQECLDAVLVVQPDGRSSGEAFALFDSPLTAAKMRDALNGKELDGRWLHLIHTNRQEMVLTIEGGSGAMGGAMMGAAMPGGPHAYGPPGAAGAAPFGAPGAYGAYGMTPQVPRDMSCLRLRGIPWTTTAEDVATFFSGYRLLPLPHGVLICSNASGRPAGEAYAAFESEAEAQRALVALNREQMGSRYVELFKCNRAEMFQIAEAGGVKGPGGRPRGPGGAMGAAPGPYGGAYGAYGQAGYGAPAMGYDQRAASAFDQRARAAYDQRGPPGAAPAAGVYTCCKLRGLPFSATHQDIFQFFTGLNVIGTLFVRDPSGRPTGEAFCEFQTPYEVTLAAQRHRQHMGTRYVEVFPCAKEEVLGYYNQSGGEGQAPGAPGAAGPPSAGAPAAGPAPGAQPPGANGGYAAYGAAHQGAYGGHPGPQGAPRGQPMPGMPQAPQGYDQVYGAPQGAAGAPGAQPGYGYYAQQAQAPGSYGAPPQDGMQAQQAAYPHNAY